MVEDHAAILKHFLDVVGVPADVQVTFEDEYLVIVKTDAYDSRRAYIDRWFTLVERGDDCVILKERLRGTGNTNY
jgi:hypothetical protein